MKPGATDLRSEGVRAALLALYEANEGVLPPSKVVDSARDPSSVLHDEFEWDDDAAAESYRLAQAGALIRRIRLHIIKFNPKTRKVTATITRQFQSRQSRRGDGYETVQDIMADENKRAELLDQVLREMRSYRKRYADLVELEAVWTAIDGASELIQSEPATDNAGQAAQA